MASVSIDYPLAQQQRIIDALCYDGGWTSDLGVTKAAFTKAHIAAIVKQRVLDAERAMARETALATITDPTAVDVT